MTVIYKNEYQLRVNKEKQNINSTHEHAAESIDRILKKHDIKRVDDLAYPGISEEKLEGDVKQVSARYGIEAPDRRSIHTYQFSPDADTKLISEELRKLPYVRSAYMTPQVETTATATLLSEHSLSTSLPKQTNDTGFNAPETSTWWWFNRSKIFQGWSAYKTTSNVPVDMPHLAIVDTGFDTRSATQDKPNYTSGNSVMYDPFAPSPWTIGTDVMQYQSDDPRATFSHGAMVASVAASPKNNQVSSGDASGLAGIAPGALVTPYKLQTYCTVPGSCATASNWGYHQQSIAHGIYRASYSSADVINLSWGVAGRPAIADPVLNNEIVAASITRGKAVVIGAGNSNINVDYTNLDPTISALPGCGECTIVGGSKYDTAYQSSRYYISPAEGSNYGNRVDITAGAQQISATSFQFSGGTPGVGQLLTANGTSLAAPMVAASIGMVKKMAAAHGMSLSLYKLRHLIIHSASSRRFTDSSSPATTEFSFLGKGLEAYSDWITQNPSAMVGMRELNLLNALTIAKYSNPANGYDAIARVHNIDDFIWLGFNFSWGTYFQQGFGKDAIYGLDNLNSGDNISFSTYNAGNNGYAYGYQVYKNAEPMFDVMGGVAYRTGVNNNTYYPNGWYNTMGYTY